MDDQALSLNYLRSDISIMGRCNRHFDLTPMLASLLQYTASPAAGRSVNIRSEIDMARTLWGDVLT